MSELLLFLLFLVVVVVVVCLFSVVLVVFHWVAGGFQTRVFPTFFGKGPDCVADPFGTVPRRCS